MLRITHSSNVISLFTQSGTQEPSPHCAKLTAINKTVLLPHSSSKTGLTAPLLRTRKQKPNTWGQDLPRIAEQKQTLGSDIVNNIHSSFMEQHDAQQALFSLNLARSHPHLRGLFHDPPSFIHNPEIQKALETNRFPTSWAPFGYKT